MYVKFSKMSDIASRGYAHPEKLVTCEQVEEMLGKPGVVIIESNEDPLLYSSGHIPGAFEVDWTRDLNDQMIRDYLGRDAFQKLMSQLGIDENSEVILYGDKNNWWACYALWVFELFGMTNTKIMDGGRKKWFDEGRPSTKEAPKMPGSGSASFGERDDKTQRALRDTVLEHLKSEGKLVDVRSPQEFSGERMHMPEYPNEGALRGGHIPTAKNVPWAKAVDPETGEFLPADKLKEIYEGEAGLSPSDDVVTYCRIGERSSHTWFVLRYLLGYPKVRNYDGSWTEWGNSVGLPIER